MPELTVNGLERITEGLGVQLPSVLRKMAYNLDANVAAQGRLDEQRLAHSLEMGKPQRKGFWSIAKIRSKWNPKVGWVSTSRMAGKGGTGFRMASFGWERVKKASVTAPYSSQLANLWSHATRPYRSNSPLVGSPGHYMRWRKGQQRPARYDWSEVYSILGSEIPGAIARTEKQFQPKLDEEVFG